MSADGFHFIGPLFGESTEKIKIKISACFFEITSVTLFSYFAPAFKKQPVTLLYKLFLKPLVILKIVPNAGYDMHMYGVHWRKSTNLIAMKSRNKNFDAVSGTTFRISKCFYRSNQQLSNCFALSQGSLKTVQFFLITCPA
jgi:hypothetical protein